MVLRIINKLVNSMHADFGKETTMKIKALKILGLIAVVTGSGSSIAAQSASAAEKGGKENAKPAEKHAGLMKSMKEAGRVKEVQARGGSDTTGGGGIAGL